jgi:ribonuclease Y
MQQIEKIAMQTVGVKSCYALQAGREVRVLVDPEQVDDSNALLMARKLAKDLHEKVTIPGTVRVVVIRETRCVEFTT